MEFSEMRGPNKIFGSFISQNEPNILFGSLISENSIITPPLKSVNCNATNYGVVIHLHVLDYFVHLAEIKFLENRSSKIIY